MGAEKAWEIPTSNPQVEDDEPESGQNAGQSENNRTPKSREGSVWTKGWG